MDGESLRIPNDGAEGRLSRPCLFRIKEGGSLPPRSLKMLELLRLTSEDYDR
jgi:hypothetical protein